MFWKLKCHVVFTVFLSILFDLKACSSSNSIEMSFNISEIHSGFHRLLCYDAYVPSTAGGSKILIEETLPKDFFVDPYQVSETNEVFIEETVDCEIPAYLASTLKVQLCSLSKNYIHHICIPLHLRYQLPHQCSTQGESLTVYSKVPSVFLSKYDNHQYTILGECLKSKLTESWVQFENLKVDPLKFEVPVGCTEHFYMVLFLMTLVVSLSLIYLSNNLIKACDKFHSD